MTTDSRPRQFQRPRKLHPLLCLLPEGYGSATVKRHEQVSVAKPWQRSINKESWSEAEPFYGQTPLAGNVREGKRRKETCVRGRGKSPVDRSGDPMPDTQLAAGRAGPAKTHYSDGKGRKDIKKKKIVIIMVIWPVLKLAQLIICSS